MQKNTIIAYRISEDLVATDNLIDLVVDGMIIFKWKFNKRM